MDLKSDMLQHSTCSVPICSEHRSYLVIVEIRVKFGSRLIVVPDFLQKLSGRHLYEILIEVVPDISGQLIPEIPQFISCMKQLHILHLVQVK
jgi:hypothetical protein